MSQIASAQPLSSRSVTSGRAEVVRSRSFWRRPSIASRTGPPTRASSSPAAANRAPELVEDRRDAVQLGADATLRVGDLERAAAERRARAATLGDRAGSARHRRVLPPATTAAPLESVRAAPVLAPACPGGGGAGGTRGRVAGCAVLTGVRPRCSATGAARPDRRAGRGARAGRGRPADRAPRLAHPAALPRTRAGADHRHGHQPERRALDRRSTSTPSGPPPRSRRRRRWRPSATIDPPNVGGRISSPGTFDTVDAARSPARPPASRSGPTRPARHRRARRLLVRRPRARRLLGAAGRVADGRARTFLPLRRPHPAETVDTPLVVPVRARSATPPTAGVAAVRRWAPSLADGGRLGALLDSARPPAAADDLAGRPGRARRRRPSRRRQPAPQPRRRPGAGAGRGHDGDRPTGDPRPPPETAEPAAPRCGPTAPEDRRSGRPAGRGRGAQAWLDRFEGARRRRRRSSPCRTATSTSRPRPPTARRSTPTRVARSAEVAGRLGIAAHPGAGAAGRPHQPATPCSRPPRRPPSCWATRRFPRRPTRRARWCGCSGTGRRHVVGRRRRRPGPDDAADDRWRCASGCSPRPPLRAATPGRTAPLVVDAARRLVPRRTRPTSSTASTCRGCVRSPLTDVTARPARPRLDAADLSYTEADAAASSARANFTAAQALRRHGGRAWPRAHQPRPGAPAGRPTRRWPRSSCTSGRPATAGRASAPGRAPLDSTTSSPASRGRAPSVTLSSDDGTLGATVVNGLDQPVTVAARGRSPTARSRSTTRTSLDARARGPRHGAARRDAPAARRPPGPAGRDRPGRHAARRHRHAADPLRPGQRVIWLILGRRRGPALRRDRGPPRTPGPRARAGARRAAGGADGERDADVSDTRTALRQRGDGGRHDRVAVSGFVRNAAAGRGARQALHADLFTIANTIPNMLYILLAGGVFNAVLVPQLVRAMKNDPDGGEAYTNRVITLAVLFLGVVTVLLVIAAPLADAALPRRRATTTPTSPRSGSRRSTSPATACRRSSSTGCSCWSGRCSTPAARFGPMMWAPIANNVIAIVVLVVYLLVVRPAPPAPSRSAPSPPARSCCSASARRSASSCSSWSCCPTCARAGFRFRPRFDFRGTGLGHTLRLGVWTVLFVVVNQIAYTSWSSGSASERHRPSGGRRHRLHRLLRGVPDRDGAARDHHGLAGDRDPAAALGERRRRRPAPAWPAPWPRRCAPRWSWSIPFAAAAAARRRATSPRCSAATAPAATTYATSCPRWRCSAPAWSSSPSTT